MGTINDVLNFQNRIEYVGVITGAEYSNLITAKKF